MNQQGDYGLGRGSICHLREDPLAGEFQIEYFNPGGAKVNISISVAVFSWFLF